MVLLKLVILLSLYSLSFYVWRISYTVTVPVKYGCLCNCFIYMDSRKSSCCRVWQLTGILLYNKLHMDSKSLAVRWKHCETSQCTNHNQLNQDLFPDQEKKNENCVPTHYSVPAAESPVPHTVNWLVKRLGAIFRRYTYPHKHYLYHSVHLSHQRKGKVSGTIAGEGVAVYCPKQHLTVSSIQRWNMSRKIMLGKQNFNNCSC